MSRGGPVIAIDGPAGAGKSTLGRRLAAELGLPYVNTGTMYRALTSAALARGVDTADGDALARLAGEVKFDLDRTVIPPSLSVDGQTPGDEIAGPRVEDSVSLVSRHPQVRRIMAQEQRRLGSGGAVIEGRDIGTVVFPDADVKIFLEAAESERATRRIKERGGGTDLGDALAARDARDATVNPFVPASEAAVIDTTGRTAEDVFHEAMAIVKSRLEGDG